MTDAIVARRYAGAIFALGKQQGDEALSRYGSDLAALGDMLAASPKLDAALKSPVISIDEKKAVMGKLLKKIKADKTVSNFCLLLADKERLAYLGEIVGWYGKLLDDAKGIIRGTLTTAVELTDNKRAELKAELEKKAGASIELAFDVLPSLGAWCSRLVIECWTQVCARSWRSFGRHSRGVNSTCRSKLKR